jgi:hypothetical protein
MCYEGPAYIYEPLGPKVALEVSQHLSKTAAHWVSRLHPPGPFQTEEQAEVPFSFLGLSTLCGSLCAGVQFCKLRLSSPARCELQPQHTGL